MNRSNDLRPKLQLVAGIWTGMVRVSYAVHSQYLARHILYINRHFHASRWVDLRSIYPSPSHGEHMASRGRGIPQRYRDTRVMEEVACSGQLKTGVWSPAANNILSNSGDSGRILNLFFKSRGLRGEKGEALRMTFRSSRLTSDLWCPRGL